VYINPLNAKLNPICHLLALLAHHILHISRIRVNNPHTEGKGKKTIHNVFSPSSAVELSMHNGCVC